MPEYHVCPSCENRTSTAICASCAQTTSDVFDDAAKLYVEGERNIALDKLYDHLTDLPNSHLMEAVHMAIHRDIPRAFLFSLQILASERGMDGAVDRLASRLAFVKEP